MKVLITSVPAGSGHVRAAESVLAAIQLNRPDIQAQHIQVTDWVNAGFRKIYVDGYTLTVQHAPSLWGRIYRLSDGPPTPHMWRNVLQRTQQRLSTSFYDYLDEYRPDVILTTHFLVPQLLAANARFDRWRPEIQTVITDYDLHGFWVSPLVSRYYVAHAALADALMRYGVPSSRIRVTGIPIHPAFSAPSSMRDLYEAHGLNPDMPVVLMLAGGLGLNALEQSVTDLLKLAMPVQIVTICGRNDALRRRLESRVPPKGTVLRNLGFVTNMHEWMSISDLVVTKPGGLTVSECLAKKRPMILISPVPGQEEKNAQFLVSRGAATRAMPETLALVVKRFMTDPVQLGRLSAHASLLARPHAAFTIAESLTRSLAKAA